MAVPTPPPITTTVPNRSTSEELSQRSDEVEHGITRAQHVEQLRRLAHTLDDNCDGAGLGIRTRDCQRNTLTAFVNSQNDELARFVFAGDTWRFDAK